MRYSCLCFPSLIVLSVFFTWIFDSSNLLAHNGRGFEIEVVAGKLQAQGINAGLSDGAPPVRPYLNSIHDHWKYIQPLDASVASLPEFEVLPEVANGFLESYALDLELRGAWQWKSPPIMPAEDTVPQLEPLDPDEIISIQTLSAPITTESLGVLEISPAVPAAGTGDVLPAYQIDGSPAAKIHILQFVMTATAPSANFSAIEPSEPLFVILSPDGSNPIERLHLASLHLEEYLGLNGIPVPEPSALALVVMALIHGALSRSRNS